MTRKRGWYSLIALLVVALFGGVATAEAHHLEGRWWNGLSLSERLDGQLHLKRQARATLGTFKGSQLVKLEPPTIAETTRKARVMLHVLEREIPETRAALRAAEQAVVVSPETPGAVYNYSTGQWTIPAYIVMCESGGDYNAVNPSSGAYGAYQIMPFHWSSGVCRGLGRDPAGQDECARRIWNTAGAGAWACA